MGEEHRVRDPDVKVLIAINFFDAALIYDDTSREGREALLHIWLHACAGDSQVCEYKMTDQGNLQS